MMTSGMHRRPFEGRHLVLKAYLYYLTYNEINFMSVIIFTFMKYCSNLNILSFLAIFAP